jgi:hypothetical protein
MSFPSALALGIEGLDEALELELAQPYTADELLARLVQHQVPGLSFQSVEVLPQGTKKARVRSLTYQVAIPVGRRAQTADRLADLMASRSYPIRRPNRPAPIDLRRSRAAVELQ